MLTFARTAAIGIVVASVPVISQAAPATMLHHHRGHAHRHIRAFPPYAFDPYSPAAAEDPYNPYASPGAAIRALARRNQNAPGVTNELAPDNIATATGGPSGGVPGFSGH